MKKTLILTSVLALTACGGGSGGGAGTPAEITTPTTFTDRVAASNSVITNMVSNSKTQVAVYVANKLGSDASSVGLGNAGRSATTRGAFIPSANVGSGLDYDKAQELIELAEWLGDNTTTEQDIISMFDNSNEGKNKIKAALKLLDGMYCFVGGSAEETANRIIARRSANEFVAPLADLQKHSEIMTLDGVDLYTTEGYRLKFNVDTDGKIVSYEYPDFVTHNDDGTTTVSDDINIYDDDHNLIGQMHNPGEDDDDGLIMRQGDTNIFVQEGSIPLSEMSDEDPDANFVSAENITDVNGRLNLKLYDEYISYAKRLGLKYSDFGIMRHDFKTATFTATGLNEAGEQEVRQFIDAWGVMMTPFAGGYTSKKISDGDMATLANDGNITFSGTAVADVRYRDGLAYNGNGIDVPLTDDLMTDNGATLVFNQSGTQTLTADFSDDWYKIQAIKNADGTNQLIVFSDRNNDGVINDADRVTKTMDVDGDGTSRTYDFTISSSGVIPNGSGNGQITGDDENGWFMSGSSMTFTPNYYGDDGVPSEAVATMTYQYQDNVPMNKVDDGNGGFYFENANNSDGNINIDLGFGGTR